MGSWAKSRAVTGPWERAAAEVKHRSEAGVLLRGSWAGLEPLLSDRHRFPHRVWLVLPGVSCVFWVLQYLIWTCCLVLLSSFNPQLTLG